MITKLTQYFDRFFPNTKLGNLNPSIILAFNIDWENSGNKPLPAYTLGICSTQFNT